MFSRRNKPPQQLEGNRVPVLGQPKPPPIPKIINPVKTQNNDRPNKPSAPTPTSEHSGIDNMQRHALPVYDDINTTISEPRLESSSLTEYEQKEKIRKFLKDNPHYLEKLCNIRSFGREK